MNVTNVYKKAAGTPEFIRKEQARHALWLLTPRNVRGVIVMIAGLPRERATEPLDTFTTEERRRIWAAADGLACDAAVIGNCAYPGTMALN